MTEEERRELLLFGAPMPRTRGRWWRLAAVTLFFCAVVGAVLGGAWLAGESLK